MRVAVVALIAGLLVGCGVIGKRVADPGALETHVLSGAERRAIEASVRSLFGVPRSVRVGGLAAGRSEEGVLVVCGLARGADGLTRPFWGTVGHVSGSEPVFAPGGLGGVSGQARELLASCDALGLSVVGSESGTSENGVEGPEAKDVEMPEDVSGEVSVIENGIEEEPPTDDGMPVAEENAVQDAEGGDVEDDAALGGYPHSSADGESGG